MVHQLGTVQDLKQPIGNKSRPEGTTYNVGRDVTTSLHNGFAVEPQKPSGNLSVHIIAWDSGKGNARHNGLLSVSNRELASAIYAVDLDALERLAEYPGPLDIEATFGNMICGAAGTMLPSESSGIAVTEEDRTSSHANDCGPIRRLDHPRAVGLPWPLRAFRRVIQCRRAMILVGSRIGPSAVAGSLFVAAVRKAVFAVPRLLTSVLSAPSVRIWRLGRALNSIRSKPITLTVMARGNCRACSWV